LALLLLAKALLPLLYWKSAPAALLLSPVQ
jgi:hypothetical protein